MDREEISNLYRGPSIDASYQVLVHLAKWLQRRRFLEIDQPETRIFNGGHVCLRIGKKLEILKRAFHRCFLPSCGSFGEVVSEKSFQKLTNQKQEIVYEWWPCLLTVCDTMSNLYRGPSIDASYQVSVNFAKWFQRRRFLEINQPETKIAYGSHMC